LQGVELSIGNNVQFHHSVRLYGFSGKIRIEDGAAFAWDGGARWLGPIGIEMRSQNAELRIERNVVIMRAARIICYNRIIIGSETTIGDNCLLLDSDIHDFTPGAWDKPVKGAPINLGKCVHLAPDVTILKGVSVGDNTTIGNKSVVQRNLPANCVAIGNPARVILRYAPSVPKSTNC
jgi:acetyltransferase-like isoleucine patch superfamily enzyme